MIRSMVRRAAHRRKKLLVADKDSTMIGQESIAPLAGLPAAVTGEVLAARIRATPGAVALVYTMRTHRASACLVCGGFTVFSRRVGAMRRFDEHRANRLVR